MSEQSIDKTIQPEEEPYKIKVGGFDIDCWPDGFRINSWEMADKKLLMKVIRKVEDYYRAPKFGSLEAVITSYERDKTELRRAQIQDDLIVALNDFLFNGKSVEQFNKSLQNRFGYLLVGKRTKYSEDYGIEQYRRAKDRLEYIKANGLTEEQYFDMQ